MGGVWHCSKRSSGRLAERESHRCSFVRPALTRGDALAWEWVRAGQQPPRHHPPPHGVLAVLPSPEQCAVLPYVLVRQGKDILVSGDGPLEEVLQVGPVGPGGVVAVVEQQLLAEVVGSDLTAPYYKLLDEELEQTLAGEAGRVPVAKLSQTGTGDGGQPVTYASGILVPRVRRQPRYARTCRLGRERPRGYLPWELKNPRPEDEGSNVTLLVALSQVKEKSLPQDGYRYYHRLLWWPLGKPSDRSKCVEIQVYGNALFPVFSIEHIDSLNTALNPSRLH